MSEESKPIEYRRIGDIAEGSKDTERDDTKAKESGTDEKPSETKAEAAPGEKADGEDEEEENVHPEGVMVLRSMCPACEEEGETRLLPTNIPFFRDVIIASFTCDECGHRNSSVQSAGIQERGCYFSVEVGNAEDLNRQVVKSDTAVVRVPNLELEIPPMTQPGVFTTIEGMLDRLVEQLSELQPLRHASHPEEAAQVDAFLDRVRSVLSGEGLPVTFELDDPSGNSFVENPLAPDNDPKMKVKFYRRSRGQDQFLGLNPEEGAAAYDGLGEEEEDKEGGKGMSTYMRGSTAHSDSVPDREKYGGSITMQRLKEGGRISGQTGRSAATVRADPALFARAEEGREMMTFPSSCPECGRASEVRMLMVDIPYFKEVVLMSMRCEGCGYHDVEVKGGGGTPDKGSTHVLRVGVMAIEEGQEADVAMGETVLDAAAAGGQEAVDDAKALVEKGVCFSPEAAAEDLRRDLIKGDTATVTLPELEIELAPGTLGGLYTTVEGLLSSIVEHLRSANPFAWELGDSADPAMLGRAARFRTIIERIEAASNATTSFTVVVRDPMDNSWIYSPLHPEPDPRLTVSKFKRSVAEDIELGIADMDAPEGHEKEDEKE